MLDTLICFFSKTSNTLICFLYSRVFASNGIYTFQNSSSYLWQQKFIKLQCPVLQTVRQFLKKITYYWHKALKFKHKIWSIALHWKKYIEFLILNIFLYFKYFLSDNYVILIIKNLLFGNFKVFSIIGQQFWILATFVENNKLLFQTQMMRGFHIVISK